MYSFQYHDLRWTGEKYVPREYTIIVPTGVQWQPDVPIIKLFGRHLDVNSLDNFLTSWTRTYFGPGTMHDMFMRGFGQSLKRTDVILRIAHTLRAGEDEREGREEHRKIISACIENGHKTWAEIKKLLLDAQAMVMGGNEPEVVVALVGPTENIGRTYFDNLYRTLTYLNTLVEVRRWNSHWGEKMQAAREGIFDYANFPMENL